MTSTKNATPATRSSPWRLCPPGHHWRSDHKQQTYSRKDGTTVREHDVAGSCCQNPSKKDQIYSEELREIAKKYFSNLEGSPAANDLGFKNGNTYDVYIRGWTQFWNDVFRPKVKLDPNLVKALIATESGFNPNPKVTSSKARGLMQVKDDTRVILGNPKGELKDHLVHVDQKNITDPNLNVAAGVRWLFQKQRLASGKLGRDASWEETISEYKSYLGKMRKDPSYQPKPLLDLRSYYQTLKGKK